MTIYVTHSRAFDFQKELYLPIRESDLNTEHTIILPHELSQHSYSSLEMFKTRKFDLILAEVSYPSTGQGIELGWANAFDIPIVAVYQENQAYSASIKTVTEHFLSYKKENIADLFPLLSEIMKTL